MLSASLLSTIHCVMGEHGVRKAGSVPLRIAHQTSVAGTIAGSGVGEGEGDGDGVEVSRITGSAVGVTAGAGAVPD